MIKNILKVKKGFVIDKIDGKTTLFDVDKSIFYTFNETGTLIFNLIKKDYSDKGIVEVLVKKFKVEKSEAQKDVRVFLNFLLKNKIVASLRRKTGEK